ncbi:MAG: NAD(P)/FAD-dependent oxidoreductase [Pseudomonadales bacterium]|jgi:cation diffusion facilitator CzcD-associated flavoprotein CzcO
MSGDEPDHEVIIIGAGVCGIYMLHRMLEQGTNAIVLEAGDGPGGTWYWNRYPGARFDSESYTYGYSFDEEILEEWNWSEHFAAQPETLSYLEFVVEKLGLAGHMQFGCRVQSATFNSGDDSWTVHLEDGREMTCRFLVTAIGMLSAATLPRIEGRETFRGQSFHTYYWPHEPVELQGKRVAVIGTGATGVQVISAIADKVADLTVYQRRPNWCAPLNNAPISAEEMEAIRVRYPEIFARCRETPGSFLHGPDYRAFDAVPKEERLQFWNELYESRGFGVWLGNFRDVLVEEGPNTAYSAFIADKIRERVKDPEVAEKLIPKDHGFGTRRVPLETNYYEAYNRDNVHLVDVNDTPIEAITPNGIRTTDGERPFDIIIYATGFDAITGAFDRIEFVGTGGHTLREKWRDGPITYLGLASAGFPNLITLAGPQGASVSSNFPPNIEVGVDWAARLIGYLREHGLTRVEATPEAEDTWVADIMRSYEGQLLTRTKSWFTGYNSNVEGHDRLRYMIYLGGSPTYRARLEEVAEHGYEGFSLR